jgi:hypothetical protein
MASTFIKVNGVKYVRADVAMVLSPKLLLDAWHASREYTEFLPTIVKHYTSDMKGLAGKLEDKFHMWVTEQLLAPVEESIDWLGEARELARRNQ